MKTISIGFSPCPNDTYIFDALVNGKIDTGDYKFQPLLADVEALNQLAFTRKLDITKLSLGAYAKVSADYIILDSGSALGKGVGPVLVSKQKRDLSELSKLLIAIPGTHTTANLLLSTFFPQITHKKEMIFSQIENAVLTGETDAGLLIHEGRFTYKDRGLNRLADLGEVWETQLQIPLPLGCIAASRNLKEEIRTDISNLIRESILFANKNPESGKQYIREHAQEMKDDVIRQHIDLYVNEFSVTLGPEGKSAIEFLLTQGMKTGLLPPVTQPVFNAI